MSAVTVDSLQLSAEESENQLTSESLKHLDPEMKLQEIFYEQQKEVEKTGVLPTDCPSTSDSDDRSSPSINGVKIRKVDNPGRFMWIWLIGHRFPSLCVDGEAKVPVELLKAKMNTTESELTNFIQIFLNRGAIIRICTESQYRILTDKSDDIRALKISTITLISRSDVDRIMGELRVESLPTKCENDIWNPEDRVHVYHVNFADYDPDWLESDDLDEDVTSGGTHGYWYKNRESMRCIECLNCHKKFNPADFVTHHHHEVKSDGIIHIGLNVNNWHKLIKVHESDQTEANLESWARFTKISQRIGKRAYDDAEPQKPKKLALEKSVVVKTIEHILENEQEDGEDDPMDFEESEEMLDIFGPSGSEDKILAHYEELKKKALETMDAATFDALLFNTPDELRSMKKEREYIQKVLRQHYNWQRIREHPKFKCIATASFDSGKGKFVNMRELDYAPKATKVEIQKLAEEFEKLAKNQELSPMDHIKQEIELLKNVSADAIRVLDNRPLPPAPPPPPPPKPIVKPKAIKPVPAKPIFLPPLPVSLANINIQQVVQQLLASGVKIPLPQVPLQKAALPQASPVISSAVSSTPESPIVPIVPVFPMLNPELLKAQLQIALSSPGILPMFCPNAIKMPSFEQITQILKAQAVKN
uniref:C-SKI_SMAD_bind domain-containing protein n=1 Tax=Caenorhabditis tropicalis TaxID=1561998 RepID=A0A1I7UUK1_9PELO